MASCSVTCAYTPIRRRWEERRLQDIPYGRLKLVADRFPHQPLCNQIPTTGVRWTTLNKTSTPMGPEVIVPTAMFAVIFGIVYVSISSRHRQRMAMIEKGITPGSMTAKPNGSWAYAMGLLAIGIGIGIAAGWFMDKVMFGAEWGNNPLPYFISVLLCGGASLVIYHRWLEKRKS
jgi:hypothetical protein